MVEIAGSAGSAEMIAIGRDDGVTEPAQEEGVASAPRGEIENAAAGPDQRREAADPGRGVDRTLSGHFRYWQIVSTCIAGLLCHLTMM